MTRVRVGLLIAAAVLAALGGGLYLTRGRPMLFALLICGGAALWCLLWAVTERRLFRGILLVLLIAALTGFALLEGLILARSRGELHGSPDSIVILGAAVWGGGPSPMMQYRVDTALDYWNLHPTLPIVVTGGQGPEESRSEAEVMAQLLHEAGVPECLILQEDRAVNTAENLRFSARLLEQAGCSHPVVVSSGYHLCRVELLARRQGLEISTLGAPTERAASRCYYYARESMALVKSWLMDRANKGA